MWSAYPADEYIPLMKHMFEYSIRCVLLTLYGFRADEEELMRAVHASYDVVSCTFGFSQMQTSVLCTVI